MKIKNILHAAALRLWLIALALIPAMQAFAQTYDHNVSGSGTFDAGKLNTITSLYISADESFNGGKLENISYYDNDSWYNLTERNIEPKNGVNSFDWKSTFAITFKLGEGNYKLTVNYLCDGTEGRGISVYPVGDVTSGFIYTEKTQSFISKEISLIGGKSWTITGNNGKSIYIHSIKIEEEPTAPDLTDITQHYFWYYNGGSGFGGNGYHWSNHWRYLPAGDVTVSNVDEENKYSGEHVVYVNGEPVGGNNGGQSDVNKYGSYIFNKNNAIGVKLANDKAYRIKVYLQNRNDNDNQVLYKGVNVETSSKVANGSQTTIMRVDGTGVHDTGTRLITYDISEGNGGVYWIRNTQESDLYIGGFEVLPVSSTTIPDNTFKGKWYVDDGHNEPVKNILSTTQSIDCAVEGDGVVLYGPTMALNATPINGRTVMLNNGNKIGVNLPSNATLTFSYIADLGVPVTVTDESGTVLLTSTGSNGSKEVEYKTTASQKVWITGGSDKYVYISGFEVKADVPTIADAVPISSDYVWYAVAREKFGDNVLVGTGDHVFIQKDFSLSGTNLQTIGSNYDLTINSRKNTAYRITSSTSMGFKIAQGKKGVINAYFGKEGDKTNEVAASYFRLSESDNDGKDKAVGWTVSEIDGTIVARYFFDTTAGERTYWLNRNSGNVWVGGFEVLFDKGNNGGVDLANGAYCCNGTATVTNALSNDTYDILKSNYSTPVVGPSMLVTDNGVMVYTRNDVQNGIMFKMSGSTYNAVTVNGTANGGSVRIYKGDPLNGGILIGTLASTGEKTIPLGDHSESDVFYAVSDDPAGAYLISLAPATVNENQLITINDYNIYRVNNVPYDGQLLNDKHTIFKGGVDQVVEPGMMVLGQQNKAFKITSGEDFYGLKVGESVDGKKTGYIKVYFNGGTSDSHKMEEINLDKPLNAGNNSSYDSETHVVSMGEGYANRGWWFGEGADARDMSAFNKINIEVDDVTGDVATLQLKVQDVNGNAVTINYDPVNKRFLGELKADGFDITKVSQIYFQTWDEESSTASFKLKSVRVMNKPLTIATGTIGKDSNGDETYVPANRSEVFGGIIHDVQDAHVYAFPFDLTKTDSNPQLYWVTGDINIAAIEVVYDDESHAKVVDWYVNKDTKMIVGSDDPNWVWTDFNGNKVEYPAGYDEYVTFYVSAGRQAHVSFIMPEAVAEVEAWKQKIKDLGIYNTETSTLVEETDELAALYGKHTIVTESKKKSDSNVSLESKTTTTYERTGQYSNMSKLDNEKGSLYGWYGRDYTLPSTVYNSGNHYEEVLVTATQKPASGDEKWNNEDIELVNGKKGEWKIYMRFVSYQAPVVNKVSDIDEGGKKAGEKLSVTSAPQGGTVYYTTDSSDPENLASGIKEAHSSTNTYSENFDVKKNCIVKAAQYFETPYQFYEDATLRNNPSNSFKLVSEDRDVIFDKDNVVYVKNKKTDDYDELFNTQDGGYMLTIPTGSKMADKSPHEQAFNANPTMYLTLGGKDHPYLNGSVFNLCGTNWKASDDSGLKTYLDSYKFKFDVDGVKNPDWWGKSGSQNQNPYTECNFGPGGADTEDGGMFLQPISGTMLRFEPEYDGVITVWLRQNGCLDNNNQEKGTFTRRPVFIMDENGRIMTRSTIKPTDEHYLGINGTFAINSNMCEERSQVEHTWLYAVAKQVYENHPVYADRFKDFPNRWVTDGIDHAGHVMYGWWYKGFNINATTEEITLADHVSRYEYMEPNLLYRSDMVFDMEMNNLGLNNSFAKYGYELPNFQYVRYRIPVKAGKTYYIAGRGTKNGFSAIQFDRVKCNTNLNADDFAALRFADNPTIVENTDADMNSSDYLKIKEDWNSIGSGTALPTEADIDKSYEVTWGNGLRLNLETEKTDDSGNYEDCDYHINQVLKDAEGNVTGNHNLDGKTVEVILNRTFTRGHWHPIILPFSISETRLEQYFGEGTKVLYLDPYEHTVDNATDSDGKKYISAYNQALINSKLFFTLHRYQMLYANTPAFICPTFTWSDTKKKPATDKVKENLTWNGDNQVTKIVFARVTIDGSNSRNKKGDLYGYAINEEYEIVGSYKQHYLTGDIYFINHNDKGEAQLMHSNGSTVNMRSTRVWIQPIDPSRNNAPIRQVGAKTFSELDFDYGADEAGISDIVADDVTVETYRDDNGVYDLLGRKLGEGSTDGLPAGVYIFQGKKVYVK